MKGLNMNFKNLLFITFLIAINIQAKCPKDKQYYIPIIAHMKSGEKIKGKGCLAGDYKTTRICNTVVINDKDIKYTDTDSIQIHFVKGYADKDGWLFKVIDGQISAYTYDLWTWMNYYVYPALHCSTKTVIEISTLNSIDKTHNYARAAISHPFWNFVAKLEKTIKFISFNGNEMQSYSDQKVKDIVKNKATSYLYTEKFLSSAYDVSLLAIPDYNINVDNTQPYIDSLFAALNTFQKGSREYKKIQKELKKAFITYDDCNIAVKHAIYIDNVQIDLLGNEKIIGHLRATFNTESVNQGFGSIVFPTNSKLYGTVNIDDPMKRGVDYKRITKLLVDGYEYSPELTAKIHVNGYLGLPVNGGWDLKEE